MKLTYTRPEVQSLVDTALGDGAKEQDKQKARKALDTYCKERNLRFYGLRPLAFVGCGRSRGGRSWAVNGVRLRSTAPSGSPTVVELRIRRKWYAVLRSDDWTHLNHPCEVEIGPESLAKRLP